MIDKATVPIDYESRIAKLSLNEGDQLELEVVLAQRDHTIYFTKTHRQDLLRVIAASQLSCGRSATAPRS